VTDNSCMGRYCIRIDNEVQFQPPEAALYASWKSSPRAGLHWIKIFSFDGQPRCADGPDGGRGTPRRGAGKLAKKSLNPPHDV
jgi:hypothetical protein